jgi:hypothetical protein
MDKIRAEKFEQLIEMLHEADALQQALLGDVDAAACYEFHNQLNILASEFEDFAANEEQEAAQ